MSPTLKAGLALVVVAGLVGGVLLIRKHGSGPPVTVTLRISVAPWERADFVTRQANSARFKYLVGKQAGIESALARNLAVQPVSGATLLEARVGVLSVEEGRRYAAAFVPTLQSLCGRQVRIELAAQSID